MHPSHQDLGATPAYAVQLNEYSYAVIHLDPFLVFPVFLKEKWTIVDYIQKALKLYK